MFLQVYFWNFCLSRGKNRFLLRFKKFGFRKSFLKNHSIPRILHSIRCIISNSFSLFLEGKIQLFSDYLRFASIARVYNLFPRFTAGHSLLFVCYHFSLHWRHLCALFDLIRKEVNEWGVRGAFNGHFVCCFLG